MKKDDSNNNKTNMAVIDWTKEWEGSDARRVLEHDLANKSLPINASDMPIKDAWTLYKERDEFSGMKKGFFSSKLRFLRAEWKQMKKDDWEGKWEWSEARDIVEEHLESGKIPINEKDMKSNVVWEQYFSENEAFDFMEVSFFSKQLKTLRKEIRERMEGEWDDKWEDSDAKKIIEDDLEAGLLPIDVDEMSAEDAWKMFYEFRDEFELMPYSFFGNKLRSLRFGMKKKEGIDWGASAAREIIINDLEQNILSNDEDEFPAGKCCCFCDRCQQYILFINN